MNVAFYGTSRTPPFDVEYAFGDARVPAVGETIRADGTDPDFPAGGYVVVDVRWIVGIRGPKRAEVLLDPR